MCVSPLCNMAYINMHRFWITIRYYIFINLIADLLKQLILRGPVFGFSHKRVLSASTLVSPTNSWMGDYTRVS